MIKNIFDIFKYYIFILYISFRIKTIGIYSHCALFYYTFLYRNYLVTKSILSLLLKGN